MAERTMAEREISFDVRNGDVTIGLDKDGNFLWGDILYCGEWMDDIYDKDEFIEWLNYFGLTWEEALAKEGLTWEEMLSEKERERWHAYLESIEKEEKR